MKKKPSIRLRSIGVSLFGLLPIVPFLIAMPSLLLSKWWRHFILHALPLPGAVNFYIYLLLSLLAGIIVFRLTEEVSLEMTVDINFDYHEDKRSKLLEDPRPYGLLLRGFAGTTFTSLPQKYLFKGNGFLSNPANLPYFVANAINSFGATIAFNSPIDPEVAEYTSSEFRDRYVPSNLHYIRSSDDNWKELFRLLAEKANLILLIPGVSPGIKEEVDMIVANSYYSKVLILMPPSYGKAVREIESEWAKCVYAFRDWGYNLPVYNRHGLLYIPDKNMSIFSEQMSATLQRSLNRKDFRLKQAIESLYNYLPAAGCSASEIMKEYGKFKQKKRLS